MKKLSYSARYGLIILFIYFLTSGYTSAQFHEYLSFDPVADSIKAYSHTFEPMSLMSMSTDNTYTGSFKVEGSETLFYPVAFYDGGWFNHSATVLKLGRSSIYTVEYNRGWVIAEFRYHTRKYGQSGTILDANIKSGPIPFIAGWEDMTSNNSLTHIVIWLRGNSTYFYQCNYDPQVVANMVPLQM